MNNEQIKILAALDSTMQTLTDMWLGNGKVTDIQLGAAYGGACAMLILARQTLDGDKTFVHAAKLLNDAARDLGLPQTN